MTCASIPSPTISTIDVGPFTIHIYALCILFGIIVAVAITTRRFRRVGGTFDQVFDIAIVAVIAGIIGARLYHVITTPERYFGSHSDFWDIFRIWNGGLGIWGGVAFGLVAAWLWCRHKHYPMALFADAVAPALLVAQAIGRLGNWFNRELYGSETTLPWGLDIDGSGTLYHPTFLYEMIWNLIGALVIVIIGHRAAQILKSGSLLTIYVMWYTAGRTWIETLRIDYAHTFLGVRVNVWVSIMVFICGVIAFVIVQKRGSHPEPLIDQLRTVTANERRAEEAAEHKNSTVTVEPYVNTNANASTDTNSNVDNSSVNSTTVSTDSAANPVPPYDAFIADSYHNNSPVIPNTNTVNSPTTMPTMPSAETGESPNITASDSTNASNADNTGNSSAIPPAIPPSDGQHTV